jgi:Asp-tRNA(Asn)/Glu-tRNA(Gln) amidotransferase A subunit family amidase
MHHPDHSWQLRLGAGWLLSCVWLACLALLPRPTAAATTNEPVAASDLAGALRVAGLPFTETEQTQMLSSVQRSLEAFAALRLRQLPDSTPPALRFDPRPNGWVPPPSGATNPPSALPRIQRPASAEDLAFLSLTELAALLQSRQVTSEELTRLALDRLRRYGPGLRCVVSLTEERALVAARRADTEIQAGRWRGPLHGIPYGAKDLLATRGIPTTWGAPPFTNRIIDLDATVIQRLDQAGAILVAKLSLGELAMGDTWFGGLTRNPWKPEQGSSGSSAGSAAAVAAGLVPFALGSETLGSIVSPATICGVTGLRPTFGRVPRTGAMTLCWSLDKLGPLARTAEDCALVLEAIHGPDLQDPSCIDLPFHRTASRPLAQLKIGFLEMDLSRDTLNASNHLATLEQLRKLGATLTPIRLPDIPSSPLWLILNAEAAAAFDAFTRDNLDDQLVQQGPGSWPNLFRAARLIPAVEFIQANRLRQELMKAMDDFFQDIDVLIAPAWTGRTLLFSNMTGHPCVVVPNGDKTQDAPASICFLSRLFREGDALAVATAFQRATSWHQQRPDLSQLSPP